MWRAASIGLILYCFFITSLSAQDRYMVFFTDKADSDFSVDQPQHFLSPRAILRRQNQQISIIENDLPVNPHYVDAVRELGAETFFTTRWMNGVLIQADAAVVAQVEELGFVDHTEFVAPEAILVSSNEDAEGIGASYLMETSQSDFQNEMLAIDAMHNDGFEGQGMVIAIFDEGFNNLSNIPALSHLYTENQLLYTRDFSRNTANVENNATHGLRVLSTLAARSVDLVGAAPEASYILSITEAAGEYRVEEYNWLFAAEMADSAGVDIINSSLGYNLFNDPSMDYTLDQMDGQTTVITRASNLAASKGIALVTSAGNAGQSQLWPIITAPGDSPNVLTVGAVNVSLARAGFSSGGPTADNRIKPDVAALGVATAVIRSDGSVGFSDGTSFSAPIVTGLLAGVWQAYPDLTAAELLDLIRLSSSQYDNPDNELGYGIPNYVVISRIVDEIRLPTAQDLTVYPNPTRDSFVNIGFNEPFLNQSVDVMLTDVNGHGIDTYRFEPTGRDNRIKISLHDQPAGIYLLRISGAGGTFTRKVLKY